MHSWLLPYTIRTRVIAIVGLLLVLALFVSPLQAVPREPSAYWIDYNSVYITMTASKEVIYASFYRRNAIHLPNPRLIGSIPIIGVVIQFEFHQAPDYVYVPTEGDEYRIVMLHRDGSFTESVWFPISNERPAQYIYYFPVAAGNTT